MITITTHEAKTHLSRYLMEVEQGQEIIISRGKTPVAMLVPMPVSTPRPRVGDHISAVLDVPDSVFAPLTAEELKDWGL